MIPEDSWCKMILECYAVWINTNNDFGIFFRPILISFIPKQKEIYNYKFVQDSDSEEENEFDIPDTEINNNIFMKIDESINVSNADSTSQLEINELIKQLQNDNEEYEPQKINDSILDINLKSNYYSSSSSDSELSSETSDN